MNNENGKIKIAVISIAVALFIGAIVYVFASADKNQPVENQVVAEKTSEENAVHAEETTEIQDVSENQAVSEAEDSEEIQEEDVVDKIHEVSEAQENHEIEEMTEASEDGTTQDVLSIIMVGDILLHDGVNKSAKLPDGTYDYAPVFAQTAEAIEKADIAIVNEEVIIGGNELGVTGYPSFNAPYEIADELANTGFDVICHATNHALDRGAKGITNCLEYWRGNHPEIKTIGIYDSPEAADEICIIDKNGFKIAVLNYTYGTNGIPLPSGMPYAVNLLDEAKITRDIELAEAECDFTVVCPHWGTEYNLGVSEMQRDWARKFVDAGADLIIGTHPHVIEPIEILSGPNGNEVPVYYSLGNFVNWTSGTGSGVSDRMVGGMASVELIRDDDGVNVNRYGVIPLVCHVESIVGGVKTYFLDDYDEQLASQNEITRRDSDFSYNRCLKLCDTVFEPQYIMKYEK